jgi:DNA repair exonuclease SbcCD ATPase subunit
MTSTMAARRELSDIRRLIQKARKAVRTSMASARSGVGRDKRRLEKHQRVLAARIKKIADEYRSGRKRLRDLAPAWNEITAAIHAHEKELESLRVREQRALEEIARNKSATRTRAAHIAGKALQEKRGEWFHNYLASFEQGYGMLADNKITNAYAIATAIHHQWPLRITPHEATEKLAHLAHESPDEASGHVMSAKAERARERQWTREQWAQGAGGVPF